MESSLVIESPAGTTVMCSSNAIINSDAQHRLSGESLCIARELLLILKDASHAEHKLISDQISEEKVRNIEEALQSEEFRNHPVLTQLVRSVHARIRQLEERMRYCDA